MYITLDDGTVVNPDTIGAFSVNGTSMTVQLTTGMVTIRYATNALALAAKATLLSILSGTFAPTITSISPTSVTTGGGDTVTLTGTNFRSGCTVTVNGTTQSGVNVLFLSSTSVQFITPAESAGTYAIIYNSPDGTTASYPLTYA